MAFTVPVEQLIVTAVLAGLVAAVTASWKIGSEERAKRRAAAREDLRARVASNLRFLLAYQDDLTAGRDAEQSYWTDDYRWGALVLDAVDRLGRLRRAAARRRLRKLLPHKAFRMASVTSESEIDNSVGSRKLSSLESEAWRNEWTDAVFDPAEHDTRGLLDAALKGPRDSAEVERAVQLLRRLAQSWVV